MKCLRWGVGLALAVAMVVLTGCQGYKLIRRSEWEELRYMEDLNSQQVANITELTHDKERLTNENNSLKSLLATKEDLIEQMKKDLENMQVQADTIPELEGVDIAAGPEGLEVIVGAEVLFDTGQASLKPAAEKTLKGVVSLLNDPEYQDRMIRVSGFTDSVWTGKSRVFDSNLHLSAMRALSVRNFLMDQGVAADRMHVAGYGEHDLVLNADGTENKKASRRVKVILLHPWVAAAKEQPLTAPVEK